jgi:hypothetical protein
MLPISVDSGVWFQKLLLTHVMTLLDSVEKVFLLTVLLSFVNTLQKNIDYLKDFKIKKEVYLWKICCLLKIIYCTQLLLYLAFILMTVTKEPLEQSI